MQVNDVVENFTLQNQDGNTVSVTDYKKSPVVLFFYPRADTPGCTIESCGFRDAFEQFQKAGIVVLGISRDTVKAQKKFKDKYGLPYDLLADPDLLLIKRYDLLKEKKMYGKPVTGVERTTYVIGPDTGNGQRLLHVFAKVTPAGHAEEVFALLKPVLPKSGLPKSGLPKSGLPKSGLPKSGLPKFGAKGKS
jgi:thioredoxin-dependent peroxiredoxin